MDAGRSAPRPLAGRTVVITRARSQAAQMAADLEALGAQVVEAPTIAIEPPEDGYRALDAALARLDAFDWLLFSSVNGAEHFAGRLAATGARAPARARIAAVGPATAEALAAAGLRADAVPDEFHAEALAGALAAGGVAGKRFLLVRAQEGREVLPDELRRQGAEVETVPAYRTACAATDLSPVRQRLERGAIDAVTFASPSAVKNFAALLGPDAARLMARTAIGVIGPVTAKAVRALGLEVAVQPRESTAPALVLALAEHFGNTRTP